MLKKSLIPAALVALSSTSAFADAESFHMGLKGLYFKPKASEAADAANKNSATAGAEKAASEGGIFLVGPQFGYYISDSIRVGVAGYMGFGEFKSTFTIKSKSKPNEKPEDDERSRNGAKVAVQGSGAELITLAGIQNNATANSLSNVTRLKAYIDAQNNTVDPKTVLTPLTRAQNSTSAFNLSSIQAAHAVALDIVNGCRHAAGANPPTAASVAALYNVEPDQLPEAALSLLENTNNANNPIGRQGPLPVLANNDQLVEGKTADRNIATMAIASALLSPTERELHNNAFNWILSGKDIAEQKKRAADVAELLKKAKAGLVAPSVLAALGTDSTDGTAVGADKKDEKDKDAKDEGKWIETLAPKGVILATVDAKLFENDVFSLGAGIGVGATNWKATWKLESTETSKKESDYKDLPKKKEASKWALAGMGTVNASVTLGDVATLTGHVGYAHLGKPEGLTYGDAKGSSTEAIATDETRSQGWVFGVGIGKDF